MNPFNDLEKFPLINWDEEAQLIEAAKEATKITEFANNFIKYKTVSGKERFDGVKIGLFAEYLIKKYSITTCYDKYVMCVQGKYYLKYQYTIDCMAQSILGDIASASIKKQITRYIDDKLVIRNNVNMPVIESWIERVNKDD